MELRHLRYFLAVAEHQGFRKAAQALRVSHPSLCEQIIDLESEIGTRLFERPYQEVVNTGTGETRTIKAETPPLLWFWNSIKVSAAASIGIILLSGTAAYAFARLHFKFKSATLGALLILQMFPMVLALVAIYVILDFTGQYVHWLGSTQVELAPWDYRIYIES